MIRIKPYTELPASDEIKQLYLELVARALPFYEKDMVGNAELFPVGLFDNKKSEVDGLEESENPRTVIRDYSETLYNYLLKLRTR